ncbi:MAG: type IV toxin-antitoxin system AbiEi family antitoxin domain-containing protein [Planctomycetes bacterium]|nr:type IV toxin-antitoxin system AbiEi family antitoxin domain-containing protein [Planctomycetota bacterium]
MRTYSNEPPKTLGPQGAHLVTTLHERGRRVFTLAEVGEITGLQPASARSFIRKLVDRGIATRLRSGLYVLVPFELGNAHEYLGNPYVVARELTRGKPYFVSHGSAMDIHGMTTQPQLVVYITSPAPMRGRTVLGTEFRFVLCKPEHLFGTAEEWVEKQEKVVVSDIERTVIDGLRQLEYCGGFTEVAKGFWMRRGEVSVQRLVDYALHLNVGAVIRRVGYLLEAYGIQAPGQVERLRERLTDAYQLLDPLLPPEGKFLARWRLRLNVDPDEIQAVVRT